MSDALTIREIPVDLIDVGDNPRREVGDLDELAASIRTRGVLEPIRVVPDGDRFALVFGQRRLLAARMAGLGTIPAIVGEAADLQRDLVDAIVENIQRTDLNPIDEARWIQKLIDAGYTESDVAVVLGKSKSHVGNRLRLLRCDPFVVESVAAGTLPVFHGILLAALPHREQKALAKRAIAEHWPQHRLEIAIRPTRAERVKKPRDQVNPTVDAPKDIEAMAAGLAPMARKVPEPLARTLLWALAEMDVFVQQRFTERNRTGYTGEAITWRTVTHLTPEQLGDELARVAAEIVAEYGSESVKTAVPRKAA